MRPTALRVALAAVMGVTGISALWGGYMLMGDAWPMDPAWLQHTPFDGWAVPGLATLTFPGIGVLFAGIWVVGRLPHHRPLAIAAGIGLIAWVGIELAWLQVFHPVMHPLIVAVGLLVAVLGRLLPRPTNARRKAAARPTTM